MLASSPDPSSSPSQETAWKFFGIAAAQAAADAADVADAELQLAERTLEVEEKKKLAIKNAEAAAEAKAEAAEEAPAEATTKTQKA